MARDLGARRHNLGREGRRWSWYPSCCFQFTQWLVFFQFTHLTRAVGSWLALVAAFMTQCWEQTPATWSHLRPTSCSGIGQPETKRLKRAREMTDPCREPCPHLAGKLWVSLLETSCLRTSKVWHEQSNQVVSEFEANQRLGGWNRHQLPNGFQDHYRHSLGEHALLCSSISTLLLGKFFTEIDNWETLLRIQER